MCAFLAASQQPGLRDVPWVATTVLTAPGHFRMVGDFFDLQKPLRDFAKSVKGPSHVGFLIRGLEVSWG